MSSFQQVDLELLCNVDPSVVALLRPLSEDATTQEVGLRNALIKLQQATLRGNSTYASKLLEMALQDVQRDKQLFEMLGAYQKELEQRDTYHGIAKKDGDTSTNTTNDWQTSKVVNDVEGNGDGFDDKDETVDPVELARLKEEVKRGAERTNVLQDKLEAVLLLEIEQIKEEQDSIRNRQASLRKRIKSLQSSIHDMPEARAGRLQDAMGEACDNYTHNTGTANSCTVCQDADAVRAVIPCGHLCLCDNCTESLAASPNKSIRQCPLCRGNLLSTLKIYTVM